MPLGDLVWRGGSEEEREEDGDHDDEVIDGECPGVFWARVLEWLTTGSLGCEPGARTAGLWVSADFLLARKTSAKSPVLLCTGREREYCKYSFVKAG